MDTGPIAVPHPRKSDSSILDSLELAFIAHNTSNVAYSVFNGPTEVPGLPDAKNSHYSDIVEMAGVRNELFEIG